jgi:hypothetical protein
MKCPTCKSEHVIENPIKGLGVGGRAQSEYTCEYGHVWIADCTCHDWQDGESK